MMYGLALARSGFFCNAATVIQFGAMSGTK